MREIDKLPETAKEEIITLKAKGYSNQAIADEINAKYQPEMPLSAYMVFDYVKLHRDKWLRAMKENGEFEKKLAERYFDTIEQLNEVNAELWQKFYEIKNDPVYKEVSFKCVHCGGHNTQKVPDVAPLIKTADNIFKTIQHADAVLGKLSTKNLNINYNIYEINQKIMQVLPELLMKWEKEGRLNMMLREIKKKRKKLMVYPKEEEEPEELKNE